MSVPPISRAPSRRHAWRRLHAHLQRVGGSKEDPATLGTPDLPEARLLRRCGPRLRGVIEGRDDPLDALFGDGGTTAEALYAESPFARAVNDVAVAALDSLLQERRAAKIVEIGCGTGGTTKALLPRLRPGDRYLATDISPRFVATLQSKLGIDGATLDISQPASEQGLADGSADIVVAANVLHATPDLRATLANAANLLAPGGALLLIENSGPLVWGDLTFGLTDGMWAFADTDLRPHHALPSPGTWRTLLEELGLSAEIHKLGGDETAAVSGQFVVLARKPAGVADRVWFAPRKADTAALIESAIAELRAAAAEPVPPRVWLVTQGGRTVTAGDTVEPAQAALWGLANGAAIEHPELRLSIIDSDDRDAALRLIRAGGAETRLACRNGRAWRARLEHCVAPQDTARIRSDRTYLVTGGLAGVGLEVAKWLAASGARSLALLGRTAHPVDRFAPEVTVTQHICDVTDQAALTVVLDQLKRERAPVAGIFHAAGVLDDALLAQQTPERIANVLGPKLTGATLLDKLTRDLPIEHFVLFSSSAALLGSAGQVNHSAANACLDALAERRRAEGLPAVSICWGAWAEVGAAARAGSGVARRGLQPMPPQDALAALGHAMTAESPVIGVLAVDWARFLDRFPIGTRPPLFSSVEPVAARPSLPAGQPVAAAPTVQSLALQLERAEPDTRPDALLLYIRETAARILGLQGELPPADAPLREVGLELADDGGAAQCACLRLRDAATGHAGVRESDLPGARRSSRAHCVRRTLDRRRAGRRARQHGCRRARRAAGEGTERRRCTARGDAMNEPTARLRDAVRTIQALRERLAALQAERSPPIAVVGMSCRFAGRREPARAVGDAGIGPRCHPADTDRSLGQCRVVLAGSGCARPHRLPRRRLPRRCRRLRQRAVRHRHARSRRHGPAASPAAGAELVGPGGRSDTPGRRSPAARPVSISA